MNGLNLSEATGVYIGSNLASAVYLGSTKIWPKEPTDYSQEYFTIESLEDNNDIIWKVSSSSLTTKTISWSTDKTNWTSVTSSVDGTTITTLNTGDKIYIKGSNTVYCYYNFGSTKSYNVYGNIMSLIYGSGFIDETAIIEPHALSNLFESNKVVDASNLILPATGLSMSCYGNMFGGCTSLTAAPELPSTKLTLSCYAGMFQGCTSLTKAPELPATKLSQYGYYGMFDGCSSLNYIKCLATDISASNCLDNWVSGVASSGTFIKNSAATWTTTGASGIPSGWTVETASA